MRTGDVIAKVHALDGAAIVVLELGTEGLLPEEFAEYVTSLGKVLKLEKEIKTATGREVPVLYVARGQLDLHVLDKEEMERHGWVRKDDK